MNNLKNFSAKAQMVINKYYSTYDEVRPYYDGDEVIGVLVSTKDCEFVIDLHDLGSKLDFYDAMSCRTYSDNKLPDFIMVASNNECENQEKDLRTYPFFKKLINACIELRKDELVRRNTSYQLIINKTSTYFKINVYPMDKYYEESEVKDKIWKALSSAVPSKYISSNDYSIYVNY